MQRLLQWCRAPGPAPPYNEASLHADDILADDARLPWEPQLSPAAVIQRLIDAKQQELQRCTEEIAICRREAADSVLYHQHYVDQFQRAMAAGGAAAEPVPLPGNTPAAASMWQDRLAEGKQALQTACSNKSSLLLEEAEALVRVLDPSCSPSELAMFAHGSPSIIACMLPSNLRSPSMSKAYLLGTASSAASSSPPPSPNPAAAGCSTEPPLPLPPMLLELRAEVSLGWLQDLQWEADVTFCAQQRRSQTWDCTSAG